MGPPGVVVGVHLIPGDQRLKGFTAILADGDDGVEVVEAVVILRVDKDVGIVEGPVTDVFITDFFPFKATVIGTVEGCFFCLDQGVNAFGVGRGNGQADAAQFAGGQAVFFGALLPVFPAVVAHVQTAALAAGIKKPGPALVLPHGGYQLFRVCGVHHQVGTAGGVVDKKHLFPAFAAIPGFKNTALFVRAPGGTQRGGINDAAVLGIDDDAVDGAGFDQPHALPVFTAVNAFENTGAAVLAVTRIALAGTHPDHIGIVGVQGHGPDGLHRLFVEQRLPLNAAVDGAPQTARGRAHVNDVRIFQRHGDGGHPAAHAGGTNGARGHLFKQRVRQGVRTKG